MINILPENEILLPYSFIQWKIRVENQRSCKMYNICER